MFCRNCGSRIEEGWTCCPNCGEDVQVGKELTGNGEYESCRISEDWDWMRFPEK
ncbi:MAG: hypothetical protein K1W22_11705 [Lachnospiraceae bacterium]